MSEKLSLEDAVKELIARKAVHIKKHTVMGEESWIDILSHMEEEMREFSDAVAEGSKPDIYPDYKSHRLEELGDMLGLLVHAAIKCGFTMEEVETRELVKLEERFA